MSAPALGAAERATLAAAMERVLPADGGPGAAGAGAVGFADWLVGQPSFAPARPALDTGLATLDGIARTLWARPFAECAGAERDEVLRRVQAAPHPRLQRFFLMLVRMTLTGYLCPPAYGGNRGGAGWAAIGFEPHPHTAAAGPAPRP